MIKMSLFYFYRQEKQIQGTEDKEEGKDWWYFMTTFILGEVIVVLHVVVRGTCTDWIL